MAAVLAVPTARFAYKPNHCTETGHEVSAAEITKLAMMTDFY